MLGSKSGVRPLAIVYCRAPVLNLLVVPSRLTALEGQRIKSAQVLKQVFAHILIVLLWKILNCIQSSHLPFAFQGRQLYAIPDRIDPRERD